MKKIFNNHAQGDLISCAYFEKDQLFVLAEVQSWINVSRDIVQAPGEAMVKFEVGVPPYFVVCERKYKER